MFGLPSYFLVIRAFELVFYVMWTVDMFLLDSHFRFSVMRTRVFSFKILPIVLHLPCFRLFLQDLATRKINLSAFVSRQSQETPPEDIAKLVETSHTEYIESSMVCF
uniref:Uncharacterized protein n=1 Tax=Odontella aurita TaxID=265563 RepID=A0A7S4MCB1_9STRA|mmetsp:Transcript_17450/g.50860  ORF Transcript_17450/g.50860 Transcript_17450/m.50860 type:complete len:107 (+) Transcript_17450:2029-2349(+)